MIPFIKLVVIKEAPASDRDVFAVIDGRGGCCIHTEFHRVVVTVVESKIVRLLLPDGVQFSVGPRIFESRVSFITERVGGRCIP